MDQITEVKKENIEVKVTRSPGCQIELEVRLTPIAVAAAHKQALKKVNKEVSIPGFRKGKAPDDAILTRFGKYVEQEWREILISTAFSESCQAAQVYPYTERTIRKPDLKHYALDSGAEILFSFETTPDVPAIQYEDLSLEMLSPKEVKEEEVDQAIEELQLVHGQWDEVEGRPVQEGDFVDLKIENIEESPEKTLCDQKRFEVTPNTMGTWLRDLIIGKGTGETAEGVSELEAGKTEIKNFKPTKVRVTIQAIKHPKPQQDPNDLAKELGVETADELRRKVRENLEAAAKEAARSKMREKLEELLLRTYPFEVPASLFQGEKAARLKVRLRHLLDEGQNEDAIKGKQEELEAEASRFVDRSLRLYFLVQQIVKEDQLGVSKQELMEEFSHQLFSTPAEERIVTPDMEGEELRSRIVVKILREKALDHLLDKLIARTPHQ